MVPAAKWHLEGLITSDDHPGNVLDPLFLPVLHGIVELVFTHVPPILAVLYPRQPLDSFTRAGANFSRHHSFAESSLKASSQEQEIVIALGSNVDDRVSNFNRALQLMKDSAHERFRHKHYTTHLLV